MDELKSCPVCQSNNTTKILGIFPYASVKVLQSFKNTQLHPYLCLECGMTFIYYKELQEIKNNKKKGGQTMRNVDADKLPVQKVYAVDEAGFGATYYMVDVEDIKAALTITYKDLVPHGHWISLTDCSNAGVYCSICHKKVWKEDYAWCNRKNKLRSNFCPNCGAKMDEEKGS